MTVDEILAEEDPLPLMARLLLETPSDEWNCELERFEGIFHFYGRIFGGGLGHAIGCASDGAIPECLRLWRTYGSADVFAWADRLDAFFTDGLLSKGQAERDAWELSYIEGTPSPEFERLGNDALLLEDPLGLSICCFAREHMAALRRYTLS